MTGTDELHGGTAPLAALTTQFTPPCPTTWLLTTTKLPSQYPPFPSAGPSSCDPQSWAQNLDGQGFQYYSPAICPGGFVVGPSCGLTKTRTTEGFPAVAPGETVAYCVPVGLTCTTDTTDFRGGVWGFSRVGTEADATVTVGPAIQIRWVDADLEILETHPLTPGRVLAETTAEGGTETTIRIIGTEEAKTDPGARETRPEEQVPDEIAVTASRITPVFQTFSIITMSTLSPTSGFVTATSITVTALITDSEPPSPFPTDGSSVVRSTDTTTRANGPDPVTTLESANEGEARGGGLLDRGTSIILIVMLSVLVGVAIWVISLVLIRRRKAGKKLTKLTPSSLVRLGMRRGRVYHRRGDSASSTARMIAQNQTARADPDFTELESGPPRGTTPNPAELEGWGIGDPPVRWSWISTVSRFLHTGGLTPRQPSDQSSGSGSGSPGKRQTFRESFGEKVNDPASILARPEALRTRSSPMIWTVPSVPSTPGVAPSSWTRSSRDTFGVPKVPPRQHQNNEQKVLIDGSDAVELRNGRSKPSDSLG